MKLTADKVNARIELLTEDYKEDLISSYADQIEEVIWNAAMKREQFAYFNAPEGEPVPQVLMDTIRENGFEISREKSLIHKNELSYLISW